MVSRISVLLYILLCATQVISQTIRGTVKNEYHQPLEGVNVYWEKGSSGTYSDTNGRFELVNRFDHPMTLVLSYLGHVTKYIEVGPKSDINLGTQILEEDAVKIKELTINALRVKRDEPFVYTNMAREELQEKSLAQDIPFLLNQLPSVIVSSDAGNGIGYTGMRIRGSDASRINVTINGIPYNDAESQQVFWVDLPDFSNSVENIQVQRGLGTSTNGAGAFGGSIHINSLTQIDTAYAILQGSVGSYNSRKYSASFGTGLLSDKFSLEGRLSQIESDGYIDRASSDLKSYYLNATLKLGEKSTLHAMVFSGKERTYQAWYGTPQSRLESDINAMNLHAINNGLSDSQTQNLLYSGRTYNFYTYDNQIDNYVQDHYQLHFIREFSDNWSMKQSFHLARGLGYFEQFKEDQNFDDYGLSNPEINGGIIEETDLIRRRWLDNYFYGWVWNTVYTKGSQNINFGGGINQYDGDHFGEIIWSQYSPETDIRERYYFNTGSKSDMNLYAKYGIRAFDKFKLYLDFQIRGINYELDGQDNDLRNINQSMGYAFFNPKVGINWNIEGFGKSYISFGIGNREPDRNDFVDADAGKFPLHETLRDFEFGLIKQGNPYFEVNTYFMDYSNQLVLSGKLNDVGAPLRINVGDSYRLGVELSWKYKMASKLTSSGSVALSRNRIQNFSETIYDYTNGFDELLNSYEDVPISFSPAYVLSHELEWRPIRDWKFQWITKSGGKQYLDNTGDEGRTIPSFITNDLFVSFSKNIQSGQKLSLTLVVNNILNELYETSGYTYSYIYGGMITENFYYPQAERHFLTGITLQF